jgi:hypothetical protein
MRGVGFATIVLVAVSAGAAHAGSFDTPDWVRDWHRRVEALAHSLSQSMTGGFLADHEIIKPPGNIDPKMVLVPRHPMAPMRTIIPPGQTGRGP